MRTYWTAHALAARGHEVHVVTNAKEAKPPFRMLMRPNDWERCNGTYRTGTVTVHWTDPVDHSQTYIPMSSPFVTKLAATAARVHADRSLDVILSYYLEPYGVAGHLAAEMAGVPHVIRLAGSDAGRLWHHPQFEMLYDHVLRSAKVVIAGGQVAERARQRGIEPERIFGAGGFAIPEDIFCPDSRVLNLATLREHARSDPDFRHASWGEFDPGKPHFGIYGKLGQSKGSFALLRALHRLKSAGLDIGLVALAHGHSHIESSFRSQARKLGIVDRILQIPFLPHWRVPEFVRGCLAVCCLEQDFPIEFHGPIIPREVLLCGTCLVASTEVISKLGASERIVHGYNCIAIEDINDIDRLSASLAQIALDPEPAAVVGGRGRELARVVQQHVKFPDLIEQILETAVLRSNSPQKSSPAIKAEGVGRFRLTELIAEAMSGQDGREFGQQRGSAEAHFDLVRARDLLTVVHKAIASGQTSLRPFAPAIALEIAIAEAESGADTEGTKQSGDPLFRLRLPRWAMLDADFRRLVPTRAADLRILRFDRDVAEYRNACSLDDLPVIPKRGPSYLVVFRSSDRHGRGPILVDAQTVRILELSNGSNTAFDIAKQLRKEFTPSRLQDHLLWIENLFASGLLWLDESRSARG